MKKRINSTITFLIGKVKTFFIARDNTERLMKSLLIGAIVVFIISIYSSDITYRKVNENGALYGKYMNKEMVKNEKRKAKEEKRKAKEEKRNESNERRNERRNAKNEIKELKKLAKGPMSSTGRRNIERRINSLEKEFKKIDEPNQKYKITNIKYNYMYIILSFLISFSIAFIIINKKEIIQNRS